MRTAAAAAAKSDEDRGVVLGRFKCLTFIVHFISIITSGPPQIIRLRSQRLGTPGL